MFAETAPLIAQLDLKGNFAPNLKKAQSALGSFASRLDGTSQRFERAGRQIGQGFRNIGLIAAVGIGALATQVAAGLNSLIKLEQAQAQTTAVLKSTGQQAGITGDEVTRLSEKYEALNATVGDEFVRAGANMLLTFTNIRGKAFEPALEAILDMNTAMGKGPEGLTTTAILVGKALNDPVKGATALRRVGVTLDAQQQKQIKTLVSQNKLYEAQGIIIAELNKEFGGSFAAQGDTTAGKVAKFTDSIEDLQRALAEALLPTLGNVADALTKTLADPTVVSGVRNLGKSLAGLVSPANLASAGRIIQDIFGAAKAAAPTIAAAAQTMGAVLSTAVSVFRTLPKELQTLAIAGLAVNKLTGGLVTNLAGGVIQAVFQKGGSPANPLFVMDVGGGIGKGLLGAGAAAAGVGTGVAVAAIAAAVVGTVISSIPFIERNNAMAAKGLNAAEIAAVKYYQSDQATQQAALKHGLLLPTRKDFESGLAKLQSGEMFGPPTPNKVTRPAFVDSPRTSAANLKDLEAILARGRAAGFKPTLAAAQATNQKNLERLAAAQLAENKRTTNAVLGLAEPGGGLKGSKASPGPKGMTIYPGDLRGSKASPGADPAFVNRLGEITSAIKSGDTRSELAGIRMAVASQSRQVPITNVRVNVNVTAAQVSKSVVIQRRFGPSGGSRVKGGGANDGI